MPNRDATSSWSGYIYQSIVGLIVACEMISNLEDEGARDHHIILTYEQSEDFSLSVLDNNNDLILTCNHQAKYRKSDTRSDYYEALRILIRASYESRNAYRSPAFYLNLSTQVTFEDTTALNLRAADINNLIFKYADGRSYLPGAEVFEKLRNWLATLGGRLGHTGLNGSDIENAAAIMISIVDEYIVETKEKRQTDSTFKKDIRVRDLLEDAFSKCRTLNEELCGRILKGRFSDAYYQFIEMYGEIPNLKKVFDHVSGLNPNEILKFVRQIEVHKDNQGLVDILGAFRQLEDLWDIMFTIVKDCRIEVDLSDVTLSKSGKLYRPTTFRMSGDRERALNRLTTSYIPQIIRNISLYDVEAYYKAHSLIMHGPGVENIWDYDITKNGIERKANRINVPELMSIVDVADAIGIFNEDE